MIDITKDIQSLATFRRRSGDFMKQLKRSERPVILTVKGKAAAVVQDADAYQRLLDIAARADVFEAIRQGLDDVDRGRHGKCSKRYAEIMTYRVEFAERATRDLSLLFEEKRAAEFQAAARWFNGLEKEIYTLETDNLLRRRRMRCAAAPERKKAKRPLRHILYGKKLYGEKPHIYRVIYECDARNKLVKVLTIRHGAMEPLGTAELTGRLRL